jgi:hypothetical protein
MAVFLTGQELNDQILSIIQSAKHRLCLISPYIKLHDHFFAALRERINDRSLETTLIFRESEPNPLVNIFDRDLNMFKSFENIHIRINKDLHGKFYGNESGFLITSMNLNAYAQKHNHEFGVYFATNAKSESKSEAELRQNAKKAIAQIFAKSKPIMSQLPNPVDELFEMEDSLRHFDYIGTHTGNTTVHPKELREIPKMGFCIRTGKEIPFNINKPYSYGAYRVWLKQKDKNAPETYCHLTGEPTMHEVSFDYPIAFHNWQQLPEEIKNEIRKQLVQKVEA